MNALDPATDKFLAHMLAKRYLEAREMVLNSSLWSGSERLAGRRAGCLGLISKFAQKRVDESVDEEGFVELKRMLIKLQSSFDCNEFDRGYIEVWLKYIDDSLGKEEGVKENPSEEK